MIGLILAALLAAGPAGTEGRRWAVAVGDNEGLRDEGRLRYAERDAERFLQVLREVAGVGEDTSSAILGGDAASVRDGLARFGARLAAEAGRADWLIVYVSSHGGDGALHLNGTELPMSELLAFVRAAPVGVALLVVDSCRSGALTRAKGLRRVDGAPARISAADVEGRIVIASSGADELAQESDALQGSFFTHHFLAGLRGAADASRDGRVSLEEAYSYAYARTLEATLGSPAGVQRPSFRTELRGRGELILAEPARASGRLTLGVDAPGLWLISSASGELVAEVDKGEGPLVLALPPGTYRVGLRGDAEGLERSIVIPERGGAVVGGADLERASLSRIAAKGGRRAEWRAAAMGTGSTGLVRGVPATWGAQVELLGDVERRGPIGVASAAAAVRFGRSAGVVPFEHREVELSLGAGPSRWRFGALQLAVTLQPGAILVWQSGLPDGTSRFGLEPFADVAATAHYRFAGAFSAAVRAQLGFAAVRTDGGLSIIPRASAGAGLGIEW